MHGQKSKQAGFTLVELLIVIAIVGILAAVLLPVLLTSRSRGYNVAAQTCASALAKAANIYWINNINDPNYPAPTALTTDTITYGTQSCLYPGLNISGSAGTNTSFEYEVFHDLGNKIYTVDEAKVVITNKP